MKVIVNLSSVVTSFDGTSDTINHHANGMLKATGSTLRLSFPLSGMMQTLVYSADEPHLLELIRGGDRLVFDTSLPETEGRYKTEYIVLFPTINTHKLCCDLTEKGGNLSLNYTLSLEGEVQHFCMEIEVTPAP